MFEDKQYLFRSVKRLPIEDRYDKMVFDKLMPLQDILQPDEEIDFETPHGTNGTDIDHMVISMIKQGTFDVHSSTEVYESWDNSEISSALHASITLKNKTPFQTVN